MNANVQFMKDFVEGKVSGEEFFARLDDDSSLQNLLFDHDNLHRWKNTYIEYEGYGTSEVFISSNRMRGERTANCLLNMQGLLGDFFLKPENIHFEPTPTYSQD